MRINRYLIGRCPGCNSIVAAALIANTEESRLSAWNEMLKAESGLAISEIAVPGDVDGPVIQLCQCQKLIDLLRAEKRAMQAQLDAAGRANRQIAEELAGKSAEVEKLRKTLVESMIAPEALLIAGKPACIAQEVWGQIVRSVEIARVALGKV